ncbi:DUF2690 domain-containing protein [Nocardia tengchongensis]|uniref:DUF2690 domain-containing protein n=1 Tax=Nocardia tengchongensis TaxID=2055889 RepID=UPI0036A4B699
MKVRSKSAIWWGLLTIALLAVTNTVTALIVSSANSADHSSVDHVAVQTGDDPARTLCVQDAKLIADTVVEKKLHLEILYSVRCESGWGRITRLDDAGYGNRVKVTIYRRSDPTGPSRQEAVEPDVKSAYTTLIVRQDPTDRLCVVGSTFTGNDVTEAPEPICT